MEYNYSQFKSPAGLLHIVSNGKKLVALIFNSNWKYYSANYTAELNKTKDSIICETEVQLDEYFSGKRTKFDVPVEYGGTDFQNQAWKCLQQIPFGKTISYGEQAEKIKNPKAVRAVGRANGQNRISIVIPCHRVIGKNGSLTGFSGGIKIKRLLLKLENAEAHC